jgi:hypothetical protein
MGEHPQPAYPPLDTASIHGPRNIVRRAGLTVMAAAIVLAAGGPTAARLTSAAAFSTSMTTAASPDADDWSELHPVMAPLPRDSAEVAYDTATQTVVVSGGEASCGPIGRDVYKDTWTWNGSAWTEVATDAPPVFGMPAAYDGATQTFDVLWYPGCGDGPVTSEWNGESWGGEGDAESSQTLWPATDGAMAYDPATETLLLWSPAPAYYSNSTSAPPFASSTLSWDGSTWSLLSPAVSPPPSVGDTRDVQMVYDAATSQLLLYGEHSQTMWAWSGTNWSPISLTGSPLPRVGASMVYDSALGEVLLFGGCVVTGYTPVSADKGESYTLGTPLNDLWAWNGTDWQQLHPATSPPARFYSQMAYDAASGQVVLFGGSVNDTADVADTWVYGPPS